MSAAPHRWSFVFDEPTRILVVDDDPIQREFASVYLSAPLCNVDTVGDAKAAFELLAREQFDVVLIDIEMPGMNGIEMVKQMRTQESLRNVPIIMATCHEDIVSIDQAYTAGATSFTTKPINWRQFSYQIRYVIRANRAQSNGEPASAAMPAPRAIAASLHVIIDTAKRLAAKHGLEDDNDLQAIIADAELSFAFLQPAKEGIGTASKTPIGSTSVGHA